MGSTRVITGLGLKDLIIVDTPDALLISTLEESGKVGKIVDILKEKGRLDLV